MGARPLLAGLVVLLAALPAAASAKDPGRWRLAKATDVPLAYNQGMAATGAGTFRFAGTNLLASTTASLRERRVLAPGIPAAVTATEGYDHIGDPAYDRAGGGRLLLPLECYRAVGNPRGNHCGHGAIGVADPATLAFAYYVKLDPQDIKKAMWAEVSPDGRSLWTQAEGTLLRYDLGEIAPANAAPAGKLLRPVQRLTGALPPGQMTGATFVGDRLFVASQPDRMRIHSIDLRTGKRRLEWERTIFGEAEGLATVRRFGGTLQFLVAPFDPKGRTPTYGTGKGALLTFARRP